MLRSNYTLQEVAKLFRVTEQTVRSWITSGELEATNCASSGKVQKKWRISSEAISAFEQLRASKPPRPRLPKRTPEFIK